MDFRIYPEENCRETTLLLKENNCQYFESNYFMNDNPEITEYLLLENALTSYKRISNKIKTDEKKKEKNMITSYEDYENSKSHNENKMT
ncbi:MAG TPA: hypothetical protein PLU50_06590, partial [Pseudobdellovibrionaceae bacterium]|nr:hypothetical protein [Pseudobdellovibrionaceae bacterium]